MSNLSKMRMPRAVSAGKMQAMSPPRESHLIYKIAGDLQSRKLEGVPLLLTGTTGTPSNPSLPPPATAGDRIKFYDSSSQRAAIGVDASNNLWVQVTATGAGVNFYKSGDNGTPVQIVQILGTTGASVMGVGNGFAPTSTLQVNGSLALNTINNLTTTNVQATDALVTADATSGAVTLTLPAVATATGRLYSFVRKNAGANNVVIAAAAAETINGAATKTLGSQYASMTIFSDGNTWWIIATQGTVT